nr:type II toxin-antitoxin system RelE/ParE family toxin [Rhodoferax sp.]
MTGPWTVRLVAVSERDYQEVLKRSAQDFGTLQAEMYAETIELAIDALRENGTKTIGVKEREEIGPGIFTLHAARLKRKASHFLVFRALKPRTIEILRILHERMDLARHVPQDPEPTRH